MNITGIERIVYGVEDLDAAVRFRTDWGLEPGRRDETSAEFILADGSSVALRGADDSSLPPADVDWLHFSASTVREVIWAAADQATLHAMGTELAKDRALEQAGGSRLASPHPPVALCACGLLGAGRYEARHSLLYGPAGLRHHR